MNKKVFVFSTVIDYILELGNQWVFPMISYYIIFPNGKAIGFPHINTCATSQ